MSFHRGKRGGKRNAYKVDVAGSTPAAPTKFPKLSPGQVLEIPQEYEVVPAIDHDGNAVRERWFITAKASKARKKLVNGKSRSA